ncbi:MAG: gliding motility-associated C-terminal domain-containing protein, partial [Cyclobacteriaceae bacterium]
DADGDGRIDGFIDVDGDGLADGVDPTEGGTPLPVPNSDDDPYPDYLDIDAEDDGIIDNIESQSTDGYRPPSGSDADDDGYDDAYDPTEGGTPISLEDTDSDSTPDYLDEDTDGDSILDNIEGHDDDSNGEPDVTASGADNDEDGLDDAYDPDFISCASTDLGQPDNGGCAALQNTDGTDDRDWRDTDDDNDGDPTLDEGPEDCDVDGIPNYLDDRDVCDGLVIYNAFSPNGDNRNDVWIIEGIERFPNNTVKVFNRWGNLVWETQGYDNQRAWGGESTEGIIIGEKVVPDGSYFYVIDLGDGSDRLSGYVIIHR